MSRGFTGHPSLCPAGCETAFWVKFRTKILLLVTIEVIADDYRRDYLYAVRNYFLFGLIDKT
jgi:hypothetical protein